MNENLIQEIVKECANIPLTTLVRTLKLNPEEGTTRVSLKNLNKIQESPLEFEVKKVVFYFDKKPRLHTEWVSKDDDILVWDFRGFNAGYGGEGPHGLMQALKLLGEKDWDMDVISQLKPGKYKIL
jgi:hypothetical protein